MDPRLAAAAGMFSAQQLLPKSYRKPARWCMENSGFSKEEAKNRSLEQAVRRLAAKRSASTSTGSVAVPSMVGIQSDEISSVSTLGASATKTPSVARSIGPQRTSQDSKPSALKAPPPAPQDSKPSALKNPPPVTPVVLAMSPNSEQMENTKHKLELVEKTREQKKRRHTRRTPHQKLTADGNIKMQDEKSKAASKEAQVLLAQNSKLPKKERRSVQSILNEVNQKHGTTVSRTTALRHVANGMIGVSPPKRGPNCIFPPKVFKALLGAYVTFRKLEQANGKDQSTNTQIQRKIKKLARAGGLELDARNIVRKLVAESALHFNSGKQHFMEHRRVQWTTFDNINMWFDSTKELLINLGFGRARTDEDTDVPPEEEIVFFEGQRRRVLNFDETGLSLDNTKKNRGGRPPTMFYATSLPTGSKSANKSGYTATMIGGSNAAGEALPPHFQLKSEASTERQKVSVEVIENMKKVRGQFGFDEVQEFPYTIGLNEKAGMDAEELEKYIMTNILRLYPDVADVERKRVLIKVDSGPGRTNITMLARLRALGIYVVPGVPNTTQATQETDQNYGPFKSNYFGNMEKLVSRRLSRGETLAVSDLPLLVFGGLDRDGTDVGLVDCMELAFSKTQNERSWAKCGVVPFTRKCLRSEHVHHEMVEDEAGVIDVDADPESQFLICLEEYNKSCCYVLTANGYDGDQLRMNAPIKKRAQHNESLTVENSVEARGLLKDAKTHGQLFYATRGRHITSDDFFIAKTQENREAELDRLKKDKAERASAAERKNAADKVLAERQGLNLRADDLKTLIKWKRNGKAAKSGSRKEELERLWRDLATLPDPPVSPWTEEDEARMQALENKKVTLQDTEVGVQQWQMANATIANMQHLPEEQVLELERAIRGRAIAEAQRTTQGGRTTTSTTDDTVDEHT